MKSKILSVILFLVIMAVLPLSVINCSFVNSDSKNTKIENNENKSSKNELIDDKKTLLYGLVAAQYDESYCDETIKAIAILMQSDYDTEPQKFDLSNKSMYLSDEEVENSIISKCSDFKITVDSVSEIEILKDNKALYIPFTKISNGQTITDKEYNYLFSVASPWDCFNANYTPESKCVGVSICGLDYLCKNGMTAEEALKWYLPEFSIG